MERCGFLRYIFVMFLSLFLKYRCYFFSNLGRIDGYMFGDYLISLFIVREIF